MFIEAENVQIGLPRVLMPFLHAGSCEWVQLQGNWTQTNLHEFCGVDQVLLQHLLREAPHGAVELVCSLTVLDPPEQNHKDENEGENDECLKGFHARKHKHSRLDFHRKPQRLVTVELEELQLRSVQVQNWISFYSKFTQKLSMNYSDFHTKSINKVKADRDSFTFNREAEKGRF